MEGITPDARDGERRTAVSNKNKDKFPCPFKGECFAKSDKWLSGGETYCRILIEPPSGDKCPFQKKDVSERKRG